MNESFFKEQISRLELQFYGGKPLDPRVKEEYFMVLKLFKDQDLIRAIDSVIQTHRPHAGHIFPSVATILDALNDVLKETPPQGEAGPDPDFCERCHNRGIYLVENSALFCDCMKGRKKKNTFRFWPDKKRIERENEKIEGVAPAHRGLKEWNPAGFYEDTQEEHDRWMTAERAKIAEIDAKRAKDRGLGVEGMENAATGLSGPNLGLLRAVSDVLGQVAEVRANLREPGDDWEEDAEAPL
jgi:hypothetical protein